MHSHLQGSVNNSPQRPYNKVGLPPSPPPSQPAQPMVKMEQIQRKFPSYPFNIDDNREKYVEPNPYNSRHELTNSRSNGYSLANNISNFQTTSHVNQFDNRNFSKGYESTVNLKETEYNSSRKNDFFPETQTEKVFSKYSKGTGEQRLSSFSQSSRRESSEDTLYQSSRKHQQFPSSRSIDNLQFSKEHMNPSFKKGNFMDTYYQSLVESSKFTESKPSITPSYTSLSYMQERQYKEKVASLTQQLTKTSMEKGQLLLEVSQLTKKNKHLIDQNKLLEEQKKILSGSSDIIIELKDQTIKLKQEIDKWKDENKTLKDDKNELQSQLESLKKQVQELTAELQKQPKGGVWIDEQMLNQINSINQRQVQIGSLKEQLMMTLEAKYGEEMKELSETNENLKSQLQNIKFQLIMAQKQAKDKQTKLDYMQKEIESLEYNEKSRSRSIKEQVEGQLRQKSSEIIALKHALHSLQVKYKAQRKQLADKEDFITKFLAGKAGQDTEKIQMLIDKYNYYSRRQFEEASQSQ